MKNRNHGLSEKEMELVKYLMADCQSTGDIQNKLKRLFAVAFRADVVFHLKLPNKCIYTS